VGTPGDALSLETLRGRILAALAGRTRRVVGPDARTPAAVLVLFVARGGTPHLVFTKKTDAVPHHKGQYAFPGGVVAPGDGSRVDTALREAREEIGLDPRDVEVLGLFDDTPTNATPFVITPVVALSRTAGAFRPDGREIERVVELPLGGLLDPAVFREELWEREGRQHRVVFFSHGPDVVWGATGRIVRDFLAAVFPEWRAACGRAAGAGAGRP
jgi:8-oxo-dGTP pyrophosphatase MutT (NUDIX family)